VSMISYLEFEKPISSLEQRITELRSVDANHEVDVAAEIERLEAKSAELLASTYASLSPWQKTQVARHPQRPHFQDYIAHAFTDFMPLGGDRYFGEDEAIIGGFARLAVADGESRRVMLIGHEKGHDTHSRIKHNFGMARPEGYRKSQRLMAMASQFKLPVITLVDTAGAYPGLGAEERGQSEAIAKSIESCLRTEVPIVSVVIGEGGSGGAIAIAVADRIYMLEHSIYSVISPEGCASILWRSASYAEDAATALKLTAQDLLSMKLIDGIIEEPVGGAHRYKRESVLAVGKKIDSALKELTPWDSAKLKQTRREKFLAQGRLG